LLPQLLTSPTASQRFLREARAATRITSEHVVKLLDTQLLPDGTPLLVMEYLQGHDLRALLRENGPLPVQTAVDYLLQALQAVAEGHTQAIVHRDLKPSNLFITERADGTPLIKVLDFGIAKTKELAAEDFSLTSSEDIRLGSPTYMPPEQFQNPRDVDARADIWALGVTLYELLSGRVPFRGDTYSELVSQVLSGPHEPLSLDVSGMPLPDGLQAILSRCLEKNREQRYANAVELAVALAPFGSADARLSLSRVAGLVRSRSPNPVGQARDTIGAYEATLPVRPEAVDLTPRSARAVRRRPRALSVLGVLGVVLAFAVVIWKGARAPTAALEPARRNPHRKRPRAPSPRRARARARPSRAKHRGRTKPPPKLRRAPRS
jgi:serine/threonine-protein kinase